MLSSQEACCVSRVRLLALLAQVAAGGPPRPGQVRRAVWPLAIAGLGLELLGPIGVAAGGAARSELVGPGRGDQAGRRGPGCSGGCARKETVDNSTERPPWE